MLVRYGKHYTNKLLALLKYSPTKQANLYSTTKEFHKGRKILIGALGVLAGGAAALILVLDRAVTAAEMQLHAPKQPWNHYGLFNSIDYASVRRGYQVFCSVCQACHSLQYVAYRDLVNVIYSEQDAKAEAEKIMVKDGPNENGEMFERPGKLSDRFPSPYNNEEAARAANNGAYPPDLTYIVNARHGGEDYIFALLTGYCDPPAGIVLREGQYYNPYFPGGAIGMPAPLYNEAAEYSDGTPASTSQLAKDVSTFLRWTAEPEYDQRKKLIIKISIIMSFLFLSAYTMNRHNWISLITRRIEFRPRKK